MPYIAKYPLADDAENMWFSMSEQMNKPAEPSFWDTLKDTLKGALENAGAAQMPGASVPVVDTGMSTTTKVALAGGALAVVFLLTRRK